MLNSVLYRCPNCAAHIKYNADGGDFDCEYCGGHFTKEEMGVVFEENENINLEINVDESVSEEEKEIFADGTRLYSCENCGAEIIADKAIASTHCAYCNTPVILKGRVSGDFRPDKIISFKYGKEKAQEKFKKWCFSKWFVAKEFKSSSILNEIKGIYVPFWIADCFVNTYAVIDATEVSEWTSGKKRYKKTRYYECYRNADMLYTGIPADASTHFDDKTMEAIEPFNYKELEPFSLSWLSGFLSEKYDVEKESVFPRIQKRAEDASIETILSSVSGYDSTSVRNSEVEFKNVAWNYVMMPAWFLNYKYKGKDYFFAMNGQTGKITGKLPINKLKLALASVLFSALTAAAVIVIGGLI